jgi:RNA polymerase subunit RPABC4/transcription elongation factor Spt4
MPKCHKCGHYFPKPAYECPRCGASFFWKGVKQFFWFIVILGVLSYLFKG